MSIKIVNLNSYTTPEIVEQKNKDFVGYGEDNNYFQYLIDRHNGSPTNNAAINGISQLIFGQGLDATDSNKKPDEYARMRGLFNNDCIRKLAHDLKLLGQCAMQVIYSKDRSQIVQVEHFPIETLRAEKTDEAGDIAAYYYCPDWSKAKPNEEHKRIPAFGMSNEGLEILYLKPYRTGFYYYSPVDYQGGLQYSELEEEVANYHLNNIMNGLAPSMLINFNNGIPTEEERQMIEHRIQEKFSGTSNAGKFILAFNDNETQAATMEPVQLSDAHNQYQFLSDESMRKIMVSHRIVSPMLLGIKDSTGLGNNADELKTASTLMDNTVISPFQDLLIDGFNQILAHNDISLDLYFKTLQPLEFADLDNAVTKEQVEEETGQKLSLFEQTNLESKIIDGRIAYDTKEEAETVAKEVGCGGYHTHILDNQEWYMPCESHDLKAPCYKGYEMIGFKMKNGKKVPNCVPIKNSKQDLKDADDPCYEGYEQYGMKTKNGKKVPNCIPIETAEQIRMAILNALEENGSDEEKLFSDGWDLFDERPVDYDNEETLDALLSLASVVPNKATAKSSLDGETKDGKKFIVRYQYAPLAVKNNSRDFCRRMVASKKIYRKEDLDKNSTANGELAASGETSYNIFLHKGGANCHHYWIRKTYLFKNDVKPDTNSPLAKPIYRSERQKEGIKPPTKKQEPAIVAERPIDTPTKGYKRKR